MVDIPGVVGYCKRTGERANGNRIRLQRSRGYLIGEGNPEDLWDSFQEWPYLLHCVADSPKNVFQAPTCFCCSLYFYHFRKNAV